MSLTSPLGLMRHVRRPNLRLDTVPWINVLLVGWLLTLLGSSYIYAPGLAVSIDGAATNLPSHLALPESTGQPSLAHIDAVLTIALPYYYLDDGRHYLTDLPKALGKAVGRLDPAHRKHLVLLVKMNGNVSVQIHTTVSEMAKKAGFETVEEAVIPSPEADTSPGANPPATELKNP